MALRAQEVLQVDFNGSGSGTGDTSNIVTLGGTAVLNSNSPTTATIGTTSPLCTGATGGNSGNYLNIASTGNGRASIYITPVSTAHSPDGWLKVGTGTNPDLVNGAVDFYFTDSLGSSTWTNDSVDFRPLDISGNSATYGALRLTIVAVGANELEAVFTAKNSAGTTVQTATALCSTASVAAGKTYHLAVGVSTNSSTGIITVRLYLAPGNTPINTLGTGNAYQLANGSTTGSIASSQVSNPNPFNCASNFWFGAGYGNSTTAKNFTFDSFRAYSSVPSVFNSLDFLPDMASVAKPSPEPTFTYSSTFDYFSPPVGGSVASTNPPVIVDYTRTGSAYSGSGTTGDGLALTGHYLSTSMTLPDLGKDTSFSFFGENPTAIGRGVGAINQVSNASANGSYTSSFATALDPTLPSNTGTSYGSMYLLWPQNSNGYGAPVAVNRTEAWWIGPDQATAGSTVTLYGRNLSHNGGTALADANIVLKLQGSGTTSWLPASNITAVNPYAISFTVPTGTANGTYEVWAHNGHGGHYGWSGPTLLTVVSPVPWLTSGSGTINVTNFTYSGTVYHADNTGTTVSNTAITEAFLAATATPYSTVYFPTGTYTVSAGFTPPANVQIVGQSQSNTFIKLTGTNYSLFTVGGNNITINNLTMDCNTSSNSWILHGTSAAIPTNFHMNSCTLLALGSPVGTQNGQQMVYFGSGNHKFFQGCTFEGSNFDLGGVPESQVFVDGCTIAAMYDSICCSEGGASQLAFTNNTAEDYDWFKDPDQTHHSAFVNTPITGSDPNSSGGGYYTDDPEYTVANPAPANAAGWSIGLFVKGANNGNARKNIYFAGNHTYNLGVRITASYNNNWGEQIGFEENYGNFLSGSGAACLVTGATSTTVTFADDTTILNPTTPMQAVIISGRGLGQVRDILSPITTGTNASITLANSETWTVTPDDTSNIALGWYVDQVAVYNNMQNGKPRSRNGAKAVTPYGGVLHLVAVSNIWSQMEKGVWMYSQGQRQQGSDPSPWWHCDPVYWGYYARNSMTDGEYGFYQDGDDWTSALTELYGLGNVYTHNTITRDANQYDNGSAAMFIQDYTGPGSLPIVDTQIYDQNTVTNWSYGFLFSPGTQTGLTGATLISNNSFSLGTAPASGSYGVNFKAGVPAEVSDNSYGTGFALNYAGSPPGAVLGLPERVYNENANVSGASATDLIPIWDDGTSSLSWTATATVVTGSTSWLSVTSPGTVANENAEGTATITCSPTGLSAGTYTGYVTVANGSVTQKLNVNFTVH